MAGRRTGKKSRVNECEHNWMGERDERMNRDRGQRLEEKEEDGKVAGVNEVDGGGETEKKRARVDESSTSTTSDSIRQGVAYVTNCPICMEKYSSTRYPVVSPRCGHCICVECGLREKTSICPICKTLNLEYDDVDSFMWADCPRPVFSNTWRKNEDLLDQIDQCAKEEEEKEKLRLREDQMECAKCTSKEKRERMKICVTCADKWNKEWKGMKEEDIRVFILCGYCLTEDVHRGHVFVKYWPWKVDECLHSSVAVHQSVVSGMIELSGDEMKKGKGNVEKWKKQLEAFRVSGAVECATSGDLLSLETRLREESDVVVQAVDACLFPLRNCTKIVEESFDRLLELKEKYVKNGREAQDEAVGGDV